MAQVTKTYNENFGDSSTSKSKWVLRCIGPSNYVLKENDWVWIDYPSIYAKYIAPTNSHKDCGYIHIHNIVVQTDNVELDRTSLQFYPPDIGNTKWYSNSERKLSIVLGQPSGTYISPGRLFNSSNKNTRVAYIYYNSNASKGYGEIDAESFHGTVKSVLSGGVVKYQFIVDGEAGWIENVYCGKIGPLATITLDAPPVFYRGAFIKDTDLFYGGYTTVTTTITDISAKYGGTITSLTVTIGSVSKTLTSVGSTATVSMKLSGSDRGRSIKPKITVTDSRGQSTTKEYEAIYISEFVPISTTFSVDRVNSDNEIDDEGTDAIITASFQYDDLNATLEEPRVELELNSSVIIPENTQWYKNWSNGILSDPIVSWSELTKNDLPIYCLLSSSSELLNVTKSYKITLSPISSLGEGISVSKMIPMAFFTIDFLAGGHGVAFGTLCTKEGFECDLDAQFNNKLTIRGSELKDFVIKYGSLSNWVYRKWKSGRVEAWCTQSLGNKTGTAWVSPFMYTNATLSIPSGIFSSTPPYVTLQSQNSQWIIWGSWGTSSTGIGFRAVTLAATAQELTIRAYVVGT